MNGNAEHQEGFDQEHGRVQYALLPPVFLGVLVPLPLMLRHEGGVEEGRHGTRGPQTHDVLTYCLGGCLWLDMVVLGETVVLSSRGHLSYFK